METIKRLTFELEPHRLRRILAHPPDKWSVVFYVSGCGSRDWRGVVEWWDVNDSLIAEPTDPLPHFDDSAYNCEVEREWEAAVNYFGLFEAVAIAQRLAAEALAQKEAA